MRKVSMLIMKSFPTLFFALTLAGCSKPVAGLPWSLEKSEISFVGEPQPGCGIFVFHTEVRLKDARNHEETIYLACVEFLEGPLPTVGTSCTAKGKWKNRRYVDANGDLTPPEILRVASELICEGKKYEFEVMGFN